MINKRRVRRIKNFIYFILFLIFLLPAIIAILVLFKMWNLESRLEQVAQQPAVLSAQQGGMAGSSPDSTGTAFLPESVPESAVPDGLVGPDDDAILDADLISGDGTLPSDNLDVPDAHESGSGETPTPNTDSQPGSGHSPEEPIQVESPHTGLPR